MLRDRIKSEKKTMAQEQRATESANVFYAIESLPEFKNTQHVLCYWSLADELDTHVFVERWFKHKLFYLPRVVGHEVEIIPYKGMDFMQKGAYGILEPLGEAISDLSDITFALIPGMAFTRDGYRMGRGGGYYDKLLPCLPNAFKVGIGYSCQLVDMLPVEEHDVKLDLVVADND
ncbi:5-formyltetrahydrofolate cyclo-ligase [Plebeiibacterium marinum]|uniref:5-formyltetrahydrofolate cyclo-ligase n=1 Tax=Plebeiibacterium marinum TaxID=2992111 RepID=A0AAE3MAD4_9BACT|nr:5-formyltetrahydrofolate cyclo-ligase [Plebeiobacterium marinum]MCW3804058.1 5-formyltetrahydrofolate cyclo-ligase [Plebeiobacterium marinum]